MIERNIVTKQALRENTAVHATPPTQKMPDQEEIVDLPGTDQEPEMGPDDAVDDGGFDRDETREDAVSKEARSHRIYSVNAISRGENLDLTVQFYGHGGLQTKRLVIPGPVNSLTLSKFLANPEKL